ncbi:MAG: non-canonical purine NTP pyrophosphatase [Chloroflexi bacterium]|nr:non-canonical purine NTP pyrophosphatase [Chloroflexota bacterium]
MDANRSPTHWRRYWWATSRNNYGSTLAISRRNDGEIRTPQASVVLASGSVHKLAEFQRVFDGSPIALVSPLDLGCQCEVDETGATFAANARLKAIAYARAFRRWALADDSGLEIDALNGAPGVRSSRFAGPDATDDDRNARVLDLLRGVCDDRRTARYRCAVAIANPDGVVTYESEATVEGVIGDTPRGDGGFGYDPLFIVGPGNTTMAELPGIAKDVISHRGQGGRAARAYLEQILADADS